MKKWKPNKSAATSYVATMQHIDEWLNNHPSITRSWSGDSYYFKVNGQKYRVSNHSVESSNNAAIDWLGNQVRPLYHENGRDSDVHYIHASKTRIIEIYEALLAGKKLDGRGYEV